MSYHVSIDKVPVVSAGHLSESPGTTAPVLEYLCLFTHDLRRKQKRWQDGRLKFHTFNKRVMVYDDRGNFVGDMHWRRDWDFGDGEEVQLERGGVIVQVAECVDRWNQDLSDLLDKRAQEKEQQQAKVTPRIAVATPASRSIASPRLQIPADHFQLRHRPLNQLTGTPVRLQGRAYIPTESPFEQRQKTINDATGTSDEKPTKRRRYDDAPPSKKGYAQSLFGASLNLSPFPTSSASTRQTLTARRQLEREHPSSSLSSSHNYYDGTATGRPPSAVPGAQQVQTTFGDDLPRIPPKARSNLLSAVSACSRPPVQMKQRIHAAENVPAQRSISRTVAEYEVVDLTTQPSTQPSTDSVHNQLEGLPMLHDMDHTDTGDHHGVSGFASKTSERRNSAKVQPSKRKIHQGGDLDDPEALKVQQPASKRKKVVLAEENTGTDRPKQRTTSTEKDHEFVPEEGRRTQLRLKPRQRRGLLMLSEQPKSMTEIEVEQEVRTSHLRRKDPTPAPRYFEDNPFMSSSTREKAPSPDLSTQWESVLIPGDLKDDPHMSSPVPERANLPDLGTGKDPATVLDAITDNPFTSSPVPQQAKSPDHATRKSPGPLPDALADNPFMTSSASENIGSLNALARKDPIVAASDLEDITFMSSPASEQLDSPAREVATKPHRTEESLNDDDEEPVATKTSNDVLESQSKGTKTRDHTKSIYDLPEDTEDEMICRRELLSGPDKTQANPKEAPKSKRKRNASETKKTSKPAKNKREPRAAACKTKKAKGSANQEKSNGEAVESDEDVQSRARRKTRRKVSVPRDDSDQESRQGHVVPRLAKIKKSIKSREVIGFPVYQGALDKLNGAGFVFRTPMVLCPSPPALGSDDGHENVTRTEPVGAGEANTSMNSDEGLENNFAHSDTEAARKQANDQSEQVSLPPKPQAASTHMEEYCDKIPVQCTVLQPPSPATEARNLTSGERGYEAVNRNAMAETEPENCPGESPTRQEPHSAVEQQNAPADTAKADQLHDDLPISTTIEIIGRSVTTREHPPACKPNVCINERASSITLPMLLETPEAGEEPVPRDTSACGTDVRTATTSGNGKNEVTSNAALPETRPQVPAVKAPPRIANPATRGRKAALRSDAAGQMPQSILPPLEPRVEHRVPECASSPPGPVRPAGNGGSSTVSGISERPKRIMNFPGFAPASVGGPWTVEAYDLLGTGRPTRDAEVKN